MSNELLQDKTILITGSAGFIGYHLSRALLDAGFSVVGVDAHDDYYDVNLKEKRESMLRLSRGFKTYKNRIEEPGFLKNLFERYRPSYVVHLAGQAGVRYSIDNPKAYVDSNILGTFELLEAARYFPPEHMLMASTSSVYGANEKMPYVETDKVDTQMSFYAATKKSNEVMAHSYSHLYNVPITMFRFFTVYGPWGRPDMALFKFVKAILNNSPIDVYNNGNMKRDFTYIDDLVHAISLLLKVPPKNNAENKLCKLDSVSKVAPHRVVNIGNSSPVNLMDFISEIEISIGKKAIKNMLPMQAGDVPATWANSELLSCLTEYKPKTTVSEGVKSFVRWYREYYSV